VAAAAAGGAGRQPGGEDGSAKMSR
jgi:hypothetical protein